MKTILFVCTDNSALSQIAHAHAIIHGKNIVRAYSAGVRTGTSLKEWALTAMREVGYNLSFHTIQNVIQFKDYTFDYIITLSCPNVCLFARTKRRIDWELECIDELNHSNALAVSNHIEHMVKSLIETIEKP